MTELQQYSYIKKIAIAIVSQALKDYESAYKRKNESQIMVLEQFFYSEYFELLVEGRIDPGILIKKIRAKIDNKTNKKAFRRTSYE